MIFKELEEHITKYRFLKFQIYSLKENKELSIIEPILKEKLILAQKNEAITIIDILLSLLEKNQIEIKEK